MAGHHSAIVHGVRRLASKGWSPDAIARAYGIPRRDVRAMLAPPPATSPRPAKGPPPGRWARCRDDDRGPIHLEAPTPAEVLGASPLPELPTPAPSGDWGPTTPPRPGVLDDIELDRLRALRAEGRTIAEVAEALAVSVSTVKRALRPGYRPAAGAPPAMPAAAPIAAAEAPTGHAWDPADDR